MCLGACMCAYMYLCEWPVHVRVCECAHTRAWRVLVACVPCARVWDLCAPRGTRVGVRNARPAPGWGGGEGEPRFKRTPALGSL